MVFGRSACGYKAARFSNLFVIGSGDVTAMKHAAIFALTLFSGCALGAQTDGIFRFSTPQTARNIQEALTVVRTVAQLPQAAASSDNVTLTLHGTADDVATAQWILGILDTGSETGIHQITTGSGDVARVSFLPYLQTPQAVQEALTVLRTVADIQKIFNYTQRGAIVMRGDSTQVAFAVWLLDQMNQPAVRGVDAAYPGLTDRGQSARVDYLDMDAGPQKMQEVITVVRVVLDIQKIFDYMPRRALAIRAPPQYLALADWVVHQLNDAQGGSGLHAYSAPWGDDVTRVFFLPKATPAELQAQVAALRTNSKIMKIFPVSAPSSIVLRGTAAQVDAAASILTP